MATAGALLTGGWFGADAAPDVTADDIAAAVWANATRTLTAGTNIALAKGTGVTGFNDLSAAQVNAEVDSALADYDAPTKTEMDTALAGADDATLAAIAALNNLSSAQVQTAAAAAISAAAEITSILARLPTALVGGRMDSRVGALASGIDTSIASAVLAATVSLTPMADGDTTPNLGELLVLIAAKVGGWTLTRSGTTLTATLPGGGTMAWTLAPSADAATSIDRTG